MHCFTMLRTMKFEMPFSVSPKLKNSPVWAYCTTTSFFPEHFLSSASAPTAFEVGVSEECLFFKKESFFKGNNGSHGGERCEEHSFPLLTPFFNRPTLLLRMIIKWGYQNFIFHPLLPKKDRDEGGWKLVTWKTTSKNGAQSTGLKT